MIFVQKVLSAFIIFSLLSCPASMMIQVPAVSLWGSVAAFTSECDHWRLSPQISLPNLQEFTVCFYLKLEMEDLFLWTAFMYRHPEAQYTELGLGGKFGRLVVWLFGTEWTTRQINLNVSRWYMLCLTWTHTKGKPTLYIDGNPEDIVAAYNIYNTSSTHPSCFRIAPNGTLTLGVTHQLVNGDIQVVPNTGMLGKLSLFRLWRREQSQKEVTSLKCTEGDLVMWLRDDWDTQSCAPVRDSSLHCEWSIYEVKLMFAIMPGNDTELNTARDIAHQWLSEVLPKDIYLHRMSVFDVTSSSAEDSLIKTSNADRQVWWNPSFKRYNCLVHVTVSPSSDVALMQNKMHTVLKKSYFPPSSHLQLLPDPENIYTTAVESFTAATTSPTDVVTKPSPVTTTTMGITTTGTTSSATAMTFTKSAVNVSDLYFQVKLNVSITGSCDTEQTICIWLNSSLPDDIIMLPDLQLIPKSQRQNPNLRSNLANSEPVVVYGFSRVSCIFQVHIMMSLSTAQEIEEQIRGILLTPYDDGSASIATEDIQIRRILVINCNAEIIMTNKGLFKWPVTSGGQNATHRCPKNPQFYTTRHCKLSLSSHWLFPDLDHCSLLVKTIHDLVHVQVIAENALHVVEMIESLIRNQSTLNYDDLVTVLNKLEDIVNIGMVTPTLGQALINIISDILESDSDLMPFTNTILNITEAVGNRMLGYEGFSTLVAPALAISVVDVVPGHFSSLSFGVSSDHAGTKPKVFIDKDPFNSTVAFISLPSVLQQSFPHNSWNPTPPRVMFQFYGIPVLFRTSEKGQTLNTFVVAASITNASSPIKDLNEHIEVIFQHLTPNTLFKDVQCVYWNFNKNNGHGGWDDYGCRKYSTSSNFTTCLCNHLTHFGVLLDVSRTQLDPANEQILTIITYVGCGVSSLFLGITVLTYSVFEKLRRDYPSQILTNLSLALLGLNLVFLVNSWLSSWGVYGLCVAVAAMLHYFLLASFTWMGLEAIHMYFALVKVFNVYVPSYILKLCAMGWGIPLVICSLVLIVNTQAYGSDPYSDAQSGLKLLDNSDNFCWLQDNVAFYLSVVTYAVLIFLFNIAVFVVVLIQIHHMRVNSSAGTRRGLMHDLKGVASLTLLLGLTWTVGFFTWGPARVFLLYLFSVLNSLQGLFIFLFHCLMKENVRKQWRIHLCFGHFRLEKYSEWSNSASVWGVAKPRSNPPRTSVPSVHSVKSSSTNSTSASSDSSQRDSSSKRPNLGLLVNLALPRAQRSVSGTGALPSHRGTNPTPGWRNHLLGQQKQR